MRLRSQKGITVAVGLVGLLSGCGTQHPANPPQLTVDSAAPTRSALDEMPTAPTSGLTQGLTLPLAEYATGPVDAYAWQIAVQEQWRSCMARYGIDNFGPPPVSERSVVAQVNLTMGRRYGVSDIEQAKQYGYHLPDNTPEASHWEPAPGVETTIFTGAGPEITSGSYKGKELVEGGCRGEASRKFPMPQTPEAQELSNTVFEQSKNDAAVVTVIAKWASCMEKAGIKRSDPLEDLAGAGIQLTTPAASAEEIAQAVADVTCKKETGLIDVWSAEEKKREEGAIVANKSTLANEKNLKDKNLAKVRQAYEAASN